jgi:protein-disulfide isomerase
MVPVSERDHIKGLAKATVTVVEYGDYGCPHCGRLHHILNAIESYMGRRLRLVYRHFPLGVIHRHARLAAEATEAAAAQGKFWQMHASVYDHQRALGASAVFAYAATLQLDMARFTLELDQHVHSDRVWVDLVGGVRSGVHATPTLFVNGVRHDGSHDMPTLLHAVDEAARVVAEVRTPGVRSLRNSR